MTEYLKFLVPCFAGILVVLVGHWIGEPDLQKIGVGAIGGSFASLAVPNYVRMSRNPTTPLTRGKRR